MILRLLELKEIIKGLLDRYGIYFESLLKFVGSFMMFCLFSTSFGYNHTLNNIIILIGLSIICALTPDSIFVGCISLYSLAQAFGVSAILAGALFVIYTLIYLMYVRFSPKQVFIIIIIPFLYVLKIPFIMPLICGLFFAPISIVSNILGILIYYIFVSIKAAASVSESVGIADTVNFFNYVVNDLIKNQFMIFSMFVFAFITLITFIIRKQKFKHASNIAILSASIFCLVCFVLSTVIFPDSITMVQALLGSILSCFLGYIAQFFRMSLDYSGTKNIQFEDDEYYYYVKAVPKLSVSAPDKQVKTIHAQKPNNNTANLSEIFNRTDDNM